MFLIRGIVFLAAFIIVSGFIFNRFPGVRAYTIDKLIPKDSKEEKLKTLEEKMKDLRSALNISDGKKTTAELEKQINTARAIAQESEDIIHLPNNEKENILIQTGTFIGKIINGFSGESVCESK